MKILGIDEAGKGPVIGPLVICGYLINEDKLTELSQTGVKDSKMLTPAKRSKLEPLLKEMADDVIILKMSASEIDTLRDVTNLNRLEIGKMSRIINMIRPDKVIIDAIEANVKAFKKKVCRDLDHECEIICENYADKNHIEVSAASIMAKVCRDREIEELRRIYGDIGSGYTSDPVTIAFLKNWIKKNKEFPDFVRRSWITAQLMMEEKEQKKVRDFLG